MKRYEGFLEEHIEYFGLRGKLESLQYKVSVQKVTGNPFMLHLKCEPKDPYDTFFSFRLNFAKDNVEILNGAPEHYFNTKNKIFSILQQFFFSFCSFQDIKLLVFRPCIQNKAFQQTYFQNYFESEGFQMISEEEGTFLSEINVLDKEDVCYIKEVQPNILPKNKKTRPNLVHSIVLLQKIEPTFKLTESLKKDMHQAYYTYFGHKSIIRILHKEEQFFFYEETLSFVAPLTNGVLSEEDAKHFLEVIEKKYRLEYLFHAPSFPLASTTLGNGLASQIVSVIQEKLSWKEILLKVQNLEYNDFDFEDCKVFEINSHYFIIEQSIRSARIVFHSNNQENVENFFRTRLENKLKDAFPKSIKQKG